MNLTRTCKAFFVVWTSLACVFLLAGTSAALDVYLAAKAFNKTIVLNGQGAAAVVPMWGFVQDADSDLSTDGGETPTAPGPMITVPASDPVLNIHLRNDLPEPISVVIPGQAASLAPTRLPDGRVRSFTYETAPGAVGTYTWNLRPGTYLYQSGTHPAVQVQMGLYGCVKKDFSAGQAYAGPSTAYDNEVVLLYSEIDPALHAAVANGTYGTQAYPSPIQYAPRYFLVNGDPYPAAEPIADHALTSGERVLLRFLNAGLESRVPTLQNLFVRVVAEDGHAYLYPKEQYSVLLAAGKTVDALLAAPASAGAVSYPIYDRRLGLTNGTTAPGGMLAFLEIGPGGPADTFGPVTSGVAAAPNPTNGAPTVTLSANADDSGTGGSHIAGAEWWTGPDPGEGAGAPMAAADGAFDEPAEALTAQIDVSLWPAGDVQLWARSRDTAGNWGSAGSTSLSVTTAPADTVAIVLVSYRSSDGRLRVRATSTASGGSVTLTAYAGYGANPPTLLGTLAWRPNSQDYRRDFNGVFPKPDFLTVTSTGGGSVTVPVP